MQFAEAFDLLKKGKKIIRKLWKDNPEYNYAFICLSKQDCHSEKYDCIKEQYTDGSFTKSPVCEFNVKDLLADDWEEVPDNFITVTIPQREPFCIDGEKAAKIMKILFG